MLAGHEVAAKQTAEIKADAKKSARGPRPTTSKKAEKPVPKSGLDKLYDKN